MNSLKSVLAVSLALGLAVVSSGCNSPTTALKFFETMDMSVTTTSGQSFINLSSTFDLGNVSLAELSFDILDPKSKAVAGVVNFSTLPNGQAKITLSASTALIDHGDITSGMTLPNNAAIPALLGVQTNTLVGIPFANNSMVYVGGDLKTAVFAGVAVGISALGQVMSQLQVPANIFLSDTFSPTLLAVGGIYSSNIANQNGIAVFGKYTPPASMQMAAAPGEDSPVVTHVRKLQMDHYSKKNLRNLRKFFYGKPKVVQPE